MKHLSLVIFTVLAQASAGLYLMLCLLQLTDQSTTPAIMIRGYVLSLLLLGIAGIASITHLGKPLRVMNVMNGLAHGSPLSWEIISVSLFGGATFVTAVLSFKGHSFAQQPVLPVITSVLGLIMVYAISLVYTLPTVKVWNTPWTLVQFLTTTVLSGCVLASVLISFDGYNSQLLTVIAVIIFCIIMLQLPLIARFIGQLEGASTKAVNSKLPIIRMVLLVPGCLLWLLSMMKDQTSTGWVLAGALLLISSEIAGRIYFYDLLNLREI